MRLNHHRLTAADLAMLAGTLAAAGALRRVPPTLVLDPREAPVPYQFGRVSQTPARRTVPKIRGKAAVKAAKRARQAQRARVA